MTFAIIDPYLLHVDEERGLKPVGASVLEALVTMLRERALLLPYDRFYWPRLVDQFLEPLRRRMSRDRHYCSRLTALRTQARAYELPVLPGGTPARTTGFEQMFGDLGAEWVRRMEDVMVACVSLDETILVTRLIRGRNAEPSDHQGYASVFIEKTCWQLGVHLRGREPAPVPCVCSSRNLDVSWTCRYADGLPAHEDGGRFPFYPPDDWPDPLRQAFRTHKARPAWHDQLDLYWAEPRAQDATSKSYHFDVYLDDNRAMAEKHDDYYLNIARWRPDHASDGQPAPGEIHHPVDNKKTGWRR